MTAIRLFDEIDIQAFLECKAGSTAGTVINKNSNGNSWASSAFTFISC